MNRYHNFNVAAYIRLSKEDGDKAESDSVSNQKKLILDFVKDKSELVVYDIYIDDGFSGTNFQRPAFERLIRDIESGKVNCVIVKDLSRFGRDYIETGRYLERFFPEYDVRFISITDNIDSEKQIYDMLLPIRNIFNEQYARDISQKIHASLQTKQKAGEFIGAFAPYGYRKAPDNKNKLIIDDYAAAIVRRIFDLYLKGFGKIRIAGILNGEGIPCPSEYKRQNGDMYRNSKNPDRISCWTYSTVNRILENEMYIGNMVQGRKSQRMRSKAKVKKREDWIVVCRTHEAIIDRDTWEKTQRLLKCRVREENRVTERSLFAGFLKCGNCNCAMVKKSGRNEKMKENPAVAANYYCGTYIRSGRQFCTPHSISHRKLEGLVMEDLRRIISKINETNIRNEAIVTKSPGIRRLLKLGEIDKLDRETVIEIFHEIIVYENQKVEIIYNFSDELEDFMNGVRDIREDAQHNK